MELREPIAGAGMALTPDGEAEGLEDGATDGVPVILTGPVERENIRNEIEERLMAVDGPGSQTSATVWSGVTDLGCSCRSGVTDLGYSWVGVTDPGYSWSGVTDLGCSCSPSGVTDLGYSWSGVTDPGYSFARCTLKSLMAVDGPGSQTSATILLDAN